MQLNHKTLFFLIFSFVLTACGGSGSGDSDISSGTTDSFNNNPPSNLEYKIPSTLAQKPASQANRALRLAAKPAQRVASNSYAYSDLKNQLAEAETERLSSNLMLTYIESIWSQVESLCPNIETADCSIDANTISFVISQTMIDEEIALNESLGWYNQAELIALAEELQNQLGSSIALGQIDYKKITADKYNFSISIDLTNFFLSQLELENIGLTEENFNITKASMQAKWSADQNYIYTSTQLDFTLFGENYKSTGYIALNSSSGSIVYSYNDSGTGYSSEYRTTLDKLNDGKNGIKLLSTWSSDYGTSQDTYTSKGQINDDGGYLETESSYTFSGIKSTYFNKESFDKDGNRLSGSYCDEFGSIDCSNQANWIDDSAYAQSFDEWATAEPDLYLSETEFYSEDFVDLSTNIQLTGLGSNIEYFVIVASDTVAPDFDNILCYGFQYTVDTVAETYLDCFGAEPSQFTNGLTVYTENFDIDTFEFSYVLATGVTAVFTE